MASKTAKRKTVPNPSIQGSKPRLTASAQAVAAMQAKAEERERVRAQQEAERAATATVQRGVAETMRLASGRGEEVALTAAGRVAVARDGLKWIRDKGYVAQPHYDAGLRFRADYELANGTGVMSCLADPGQGGAFEPHKAGPTDRMLLARGKVRDAIAAMGTPELAPYLTRVAGEGVMLNDPLFVKDPRRVSDHVLPCRIAFDLLARHYGMIR